MQYTTFKLMLLHVDLIFKFNCWREFFILKFRLLCVSCNSTTPIKCNLPEVISDNILTK